jgi:hypothetical protein
MPVGAMEGFYDNNIVNARQNSDMTNFKHRINSKKGEEEDESLEELDNLMKNLHKKNGDISLRESEVKNLDVE